MSMKKIILNSVKVSIAVAVAIAIANILRLEYAITTGIVAVLSIQPTKRETMKVATGRVIALMIALVIGRISYWIFGFTQVGFLVYIVPYVFICYLKKWNAAITMNSVLVSHFLTYESMSIEYVWNELLIFGIGVSVGIVVNLHLHSKKDYMEKLKSDTDEQIVKILLKLGKRIQSENVEDYNEEYFKVLEHIIRKAKNIAEENYNNQLRKKDKYDTEYVAMRHKQYAILYDMHKIVMKLETTPSTAGIVADFFGKMAKVFHRDNDGKDLMKQFKEMDIYMKKQPLPVERQEFEDRARLFALMRCIEEFIEIKVEFSKMN